MFLPPAVCAFFVTHTKTAAKTKLRPLYVPRTEDFKFTSMITLLLLFFLWKIDLPTNIFAGYLHDVSDLFQRQRLHMSKVIGNSNRWDFVPIILTCFTLTAILGHYMA